MNLSDHTIRQARFSCQLSAARRSYEHKNEETEMNQIDLNAVIRSVEDQPNERREMSNEALDIACCGVEISEGDPIRLNALARAMQQPTLTPQR